jgi:hypothetical protein
MKEVTRERGRRSEGSTPAITIVLTPTLCWACVQAIAMQRRVTKSGDCAAGFCPWQIKTVIPRIGQRQSVTDHSYESLDASKATNKIKIWFDSKKNDSWHHETRAAIIATTLKLGFQLNTNWRHMKYIEGDKLDTCIYMHILHIPLLMLRLCLSMLHLTWEDPNLFKYHQKVDDWL